MNIDKKFNPTEHENRAAIDALNQEIQEPTPYRHARAGYVASIEAYCVYAYNEHQNFMRIAIFEIDGPKDRQAARQMAESLARQINGQSR